jgi:hypothetical protein
MSESRTHSLNEWTNKMKTLIYRMTIFLLFLVSVGPRLTNAQPGFAVDFKASSSFSAGNATFPAGSYTVRQQQESGRLKRGWSTHGICRV